MTDNISFKRKGYSIIAGVMDFYFLHVAIITILCCLSTIIKVNLIAENLVLVVGIIIVPIVYITLFAKKVHFLSFGEYMTGRRINNGLKVWKNPYNTNRFGIFLIAFYYLVVLGKVWEGSTLGYIFTYSELIARTLRIGIIVYSLYLLGKANLSGLIIQIVFMFFTLWKTVLTVYNTSISSVAIYIVLSMLAFHVFVYFFYKKKLKQNDRKIVAEEGDL